MKVFSALTARHRPGIVIRSIWFIFFIGSVLALILSLPGYLSGWPLKMNDTIELASRALSTVQVISSLASFFSALLSLALAVILFRQKKNDRMALFISFFLVIYAVIMSGPLEAIVAYWSLPYSIALTAQTIITTVPVIVILCTFPNGHFVPGWSRWLVVIATLCTLTFLFIPVEQWYTYSNWVVLIASISIAVVVILALYTQIYRYRNVSTPVERRQTRWVVAGMFVWIIYLVVASYFWIMEQTAPADQPLSWWAPTARVSWWLSLSILPLSLTVAILRSNLFDIDVFIRRTLVYTLLTGMLALVYFGTVVILQALVTAFGVQQSDIVTVISTLAIAALFNPLRTRVQHFIDRRFYRQKYDAELALAQFAATARDEVDIQRVTGTLMNVLNETLQPEAASLWLKERE